MRFVTLLLLLCLPYRSNEGIIIKPNRDVPIDYVNVFKQRLSFVESSNNPDTVGLNHYRGLYQIGRQAANDVYVPYDSLFSIQWSDTALIRLMRKNWLYLKNYHTYVNDTINGIRITKAGMLAGAHLKGHVYVALYLKTNGMVNGADANGVKVEQYIKMMSDIDEINF